MTWAPLHILTAASGFPLRRPGSAALRIAMVIFDCAPQTWLALLETDFLGALETVRNMFRRYFYRIVAGLQGSFLTDLFGEVVLCTATALASGSFACRCSVLLEALIETQELNKSDEGS